MSHFLLSDQLAIDYESNNSSSQTYFFIARSTQEGSYCPVCGVRSTYIHSRYTRLLSDLPISGHTVKIQVIVRKFFCKNTKCIRKIYTERFSKDILPYARRFHRAEQLLYNLVLELSGNKGAMISGHVRLKVSPSTMLRIIKRKQVKTPRVTSGIIGVDDWAFRKGRSYGTLVVDLQRRKVMALIPDRDAEGLRGWLQQHPEVKVVSRDRAGPYAKGIRQGAPDAIQVADRFHLLMNLSSAIRNTLQGKARQLKEVFYLHHKIQQLRRSTIQVPSNQDTTSATATALPSDEKHANQSVNTRLPEDGSSERELRFFQVKQLHRQGVPINAISRRLKMSRITIRKYIRLDKAPVRGGPPSTQLHDFQSFLLHDSNKNKTYKELYDLIIQKGFKGRYSQFCNNMNKLKNQNGIASIKEKKVPPVVKTWSATNLMLLLQGNKKMTSEDESFIKLLFRRVPAIRSMAEYTERFKKLFEHKADGSLRKWIDQVTESNNLLKGFAKGLESDFDAVNNAVITPYSNGQLEGQVNRLKFIKRRMYGRAGFDLLKRMVMMEYE